MFDISRSDGGLDSNPDLGYDGNNSGQRGNWLCSPPVKDLSLENHTICGYTFLRDFLYWIVHLKSVQRVRLT